MLENKYMNTEQKLNISVKKLNHNLTFSLQILYQFYCSPISIFKKDFFWQDSGTKMFIHA